MTRYRKVEFINRKTYWYHGDAQVDDFVYVDGSQEGVLGSVAEGSEYAIAMYSIQKIDGHMELEKQDDILNLWNSLNKPQRELAYNKLKIRIDKKQFIRDLHCMWIENSYKKMSWDEHLSLIKKLVESEVLESKPIETIRIGDFDCVPYERGNI